MKAPKDGITVILCVYNGATRLFETLAFLSRQQNFVAAGRELIVVDNASTDSSGRIAKEIWSLLGNPYPLRVEYESTPGQAWARKAGVMSATYAYGVFCDDDNWLAPNYLDTVYEFLSGDLTVGAVGGSGTPVSEHPFPAWFFNMATSFAVGVQSHHGGDCSYRGFLWGAGLGVRLSTLRNIYAAGVSPINIGRSGGALSSGDDFELCQWLIYSGLRLAHNPALEFKHFFPPERLSTEYMESFSAAQIDTRSKAISAYFKLFHRPFLQQQNLTDSAESRYLPRLRVLASAFASFFFLLSTPSVTRTIVGNAIAVKRAVKTIKPFARSVLMKSAAGKHFDSSKT